MNFYIENSHTNYEKKKTTCYEISNLNSLYKNKLHKFI